MHSEENNENYTSEKITAAINELNFASLAALSSTYSVDQIRNELVFLEAEARARSKDKLASSEKCITAALRWVQALFVLANNNIDELLQPGSALRIVLIGKALDLLGTGKSRLYLALGNAMGSAQIIDAELFVRYLQVQLLHLTICKHVAKNISIERGLEELNNFHSDLAKYFQANTAKISELYNTALENTHFPISEDILQIFKDLFGQYAVPQAVLTAAPVVELIPEQPATPYLNLYVRKASIQSITPPGEANMCRRRNKNQCS